MFDELYEAPFFLTRHKQAPLLDDRTRFLTHLSEQGTSRHSLRNVASTLLVVIRQLALQPSGKVSLTEIKKAATRPDKQRRLRKLANTTSQNYFIYVAKKWLRFLGRLREPHLPAPPFHKLLADYADSMAREQGLSPSSIRSHCWKTSNFLKWFHGLHRPFGKVSIDDVDKFLALKGKQGWNRKSVSVATQALRSFFRHAERRGWCKPGIAALIEGPRVFAQEGLPAGPTWVEVEKLVASTAGNKPAEIRARAILMLFATYGLRSGEVARLRLNDLDWEQEIIRVVRSKGSEAHRYPLTQSVGTAILNYLKRARPRCASHHLFLTLFPPYRPVGPSSLWSITHSRLVTLGIHCRRSGPHTLRHYVACRTMSRNSLSSTPSG
jgi:integrase/recombinase XerD